MTGFARIAGELASVDGEAGASWTLSIKSVNHRFLDLHLRLPAGMDTLEMQLRRLLKERVARGHLDVTLSWESAAGNETIGYDKELVARYLDAFREAQQQHAFQQEPDLNAILRLPGVFKAPGQGSRREVGLQGLEAAVLARLGEAIEALNTMRETEGAALAVLLLASLVRIEADVQAAKELRAEVQPAHFARLKQRLTELLGDAANDGRLLQEAALLAERSDIEEEIGRLTVHIGHFRSLLQNGSEVGKKLDFLLQEMNREANTLLSKSSGFSDAGPRLTLLGLAMKSEIEQAREQVQNLE